MFRDARGWGIHDVFPITFGQINISGTYPGVVKAFHRHKKQTDSWQVVDGDFEICLVTEEGAKSLFYISGPASSSNRLIIPPGVWHGFRVLGNKIGILLYHVDHKYNPDNPDEERAPWNEFYDWKTEYK